ncbi:hypothetical protein FRC14_003578 [Serendipita sp. 396]|nr:hypothetical protein FRC14_003578 [Serendipita sp. 396]KAG8788245.1 hypothetical protein FRC15_005415 [Serendipita sp. 397]KAG8827068.1 hypothetical protein FRC19_005772 [Serendipita sp. 401]KAG8838639.1 hypothetical protein FRC18_003464 [Serendipita sp. 400]KAG8874386.1 hypothetical protein FRC20_006152 [Serendipita sp. 405]KAG9057540.1 hypothetical protein FS842_006070 [Serendipita sp. 407]
MAQDLVDLQFDRAVEIVQGLPKNGPIQTGYEEKLAMYSLYKQATVGNVTTPRPGMFDMLGRAKYDAWAGQKDLGTRDAKLQYVDTLLKVLRKYSDKTVARDLVAELDSYRDPSTIGPSARSDSGSETSNSEDDEQQNEEEVDENIRDSQMSYEQVTADDETDEDYDRSQPPPPLDRRPGSSISSQNQYKTPLGGSVINAQMPSRVLSPRGGGGTPSMQPLPEHPTPSAFGPDNSPPPLFNHPNSLKKQLSGGSQRSISPRLPAQHLGPYRGTPTFQRNTATVYQSPNQAVQLSQLERAVESMQASLAALHERLEGLEGLLGYGEGNAALSRSSLPSHFESNPRRRSGVSSPHRPGNGGPTWPRWDPANMGAWSIVLQPLFRLENNVKVFAHFLANGDEGSPILVMVRRLFLDLSFIVVVLIAFKSFWRRTRMRRADVYAALGEVWRALTGRKAPRIMAEKSV